MSTVFIFEIKGAKKDKMFNFLKGCFSVMGGPIFLLFQYLMNYTFFEEKMTNTAF